MEVLSCYFCFLMNYQAVYGVLSSVEGCTAFKDMLQDTNIGPWYFRMKDVTSSHLGSQALSAALR